MSLTVTMYKNFSKKTNSTKIPAGTDAHSDFLCDIKDSTSVLDPVLEVYLSGTDPADTPIGSGFNYCYIPKWNRYYFISDWKYNRGFWYATCHVDVLASYKTGIGALTRYVLRSASNYDTSIIDNIMTLLPPDKTIVPYKVNNALASPFSASGSSGGGTGGLFIVGIQGPAPAVTVPCIGGVCYYALSYAQMQQLLDYLTSSTFAQLVKDDAAGLTEEVVKVLQDPSQYIVSCQWYPWTMTTSGTLQPKIGFWNTSPLTTPTVGIGSSGFTSMSTTLTMTRIDIPAHPQESGGDYGLYLRCAPYSLYRFHLEPWGDIEIDGSMLVDAERISASIQVDYMTGEAALNLFANKDTSPAKTIPLGRYFAKVGVNVGIAQLMYEMQNYTGTGLAAGATALGSISSMWKETQGEEGKNALDRFAGRANKFLGNLFSKNESGELGIVRVTQDAISAGLAYMANPSISGINGSYLSYFGITATDSHGTQYMIQGPYLEVTHFTAAAANNTEQGRPLRQEVTLNTLSGFVQCADGDIDITALAAEKASISAFLTGGFFYE